MYFFGTSARDFSKPSTDEPESLQQGKNIYIFKEITSRVSIVCLLDSESFLLQHVIKKNSEIAYPALL